MDTVNTQSALSVQQIAVKTVTNPTDSVKKRDDQPSIASIVKHQKDRQEISALGKNVPAGQEVDSEELDQVVSELNEYVQNIQRDLQFSVDEGSGKTVIKVIDSESKETIRQIPSDEILELARQIKENLEGSLLRVEA